MRMCRVMVVAICALLQLAGVVSAGELAMIVNKDNSVGELSFTDAVKIFKQEKQFWENGRRVYLILRESDADEQQIMLKRIYRMDGETLKRFWIGKLYRGEIPAFPKVLSSNEAVVRFVSQAANAIGFVDVGRVDERVKVIRIDGKLPGELGYALAGGM